MFIILQIFFAQSRARDLLICQRQSCQSLIGFQKSDVFQFEQIFFQLHESVLEKTLGRFNGQETLFFRNGA